MMKTKKGMVELQFNWIYVAVAGAVILLIFIGIASNIRKSSKESLEYDAINFFDEIFTSLQGNENSEHIIDLPGMEIEIDSASTGADQCNYYRIKGSSMQGQPISYLPIFSPDSLQKKILSYSLGWDMPFRASYFLYLTSPDSAYIFVNDNSKVYEDMASHITKKKLSAAAQFTNSNYAKVKFVFFNEAPVLPPGTYKMKDSQVSALKITPGAEIYGLGTVTFYEKKGNDFAEQGTSYYTDKPSLFAAIYSESMGSYVCNMKKAVKRLNEITYMLKDRVATIRNSDLLPMCSLQMYDNAYNLLSQLSDATAGAEMTQGTMSSISVIKKDLHALNTEINKKSCPTIY